ncbi:MAG: hypothetical protein AAB968_02585, partial [Patescibacteria group bacterium]
QQVVTRLKHENTKLRERMVILEKENEDLKQQLGYLMMQMEELRAKVFGKKKGERDNNQDDHLSPPSLPRASHTYRRPIPIESEITTTKEFPMTQCKHCAAPLTDLKTIIRYQEDIVPPRQWDTVLKKSGASPYYHGILSPMQETYLGNPHYQTTGYPWNKSQTIHHICQRHSALEFSPDRQFSC